MVTLKQKCTKVVITIFFTVSFTFALDNGLGRTPQMGWNPWNIFGGTIDEDKMLAVAHAMKDKGMLDAGYEYFNLDDCWSSDRGRNNDGELIGDERRFSHGMKWLGDSLHAMGFKFGIYGCRGSMT